MIIDPHHSDSEKVLELLREIESNSSLTQRYLAKKYNISLGKTNFILQALLEKGLIKVNKFKNSNNKAAYIYILTPEGIKTRLDLTHKFFARKTQEYEMLKMEIESLKT
jgi:EPS-associated MarR family transcriptional regulator